LISKLKTPEEELYGYLISKLRMMRLKTSSLQENSMKPSMDKNETLLAKEIYEDYNKNILNPVHTEPPRGAIRGYILSQSGVKDSLEDMSGNKKKNKFIK